MQDWLAQRAHRSAEATALIFGEQTWTYRDLNRVVAAYSTWLQQQGVGPGVRVAVLAPNSPAYVALVHAVARRGAVLCPLNTRLTATEIARQVAHLEPHLVLHGETTPEGAAALRQAGAPVLPLPPHQEAAAARGSHPDFDLDRLQAIVFTSGTSGEPKGALLTFANHFWSATASAFRLGVLPGDRWLSVLPLYHVGGLAVLFRSCLYGTAVVLHEQFDLERVSHSLDADRVTLVSLVPTMLHRLLHVRDRWPGSLRLVLLGGAAATPELLAASAAAGVPVAPTYGLTEAASQVATMRPEDAQRKPGSVGRALMFTALQIVDEHGKALPPGEIGEVAVSGPTVMRGYFGDAEATKKTLRNGLLHTGDIGYLDAEGDLFVLQRRSDLIVSGGENVYPAEVEAVLRQHAGIADVCVAGVADPEWGQRVAALVVPQPGANLAESELEAFARERLSGYKIPRRWRFADTLPQTASGKIAREAVRALLEQENAA